MFKISRSEDGLALLGVNILQEYSPNEVVFTTPLYGETKYTCTPRVISIPPKLEFEGELLDVVEICGHAFEECDDLEELVMPETIRTIYCSAFNNCTSLHKIVITDIAKWCYVKWIPSVFPLLSNPLLNGYHLYLGETEIVNLEIPEKIESIKAHSFENCIGLKSVCFPNSLIEVGKDAFKGCIGLKEVIINCENVDEILTQNGH